MNAGRSLFLPFVSLLVRILLPAHPGSLLVHLLYPPEAGPGPEGNGARPGRLRRVW